MTKKLSESQQKALNHLKSGHVVLTGANPGRGLNLLSFKSLYRKGLIRIVSADGHTWYAA